MKIPKTDAELILRQQHRFPTVGSQCNGSCAFYPFCANSRDFEPCRGFLLMNGENLEDIKRILSDPHIAEYIQNSYRAVLRSFNSDPDFAEAILRDIAEKGKIVNREIKKITKVYDGNKLYSVKEEKIESLEEPQTKQISVFNENWQVSADKIKKPKPPEPTHKGYDERLEIRVKAKLQERQLKPQYPEICTPECPQARQCPYANSKNYGKPCVKRAELYKNK
jgi:hypothetical protein